MDYGCRSGYGEVDAGRSIGGGIEIRWQESEGQGLGDEIDHETAVGVSVGGAVEECGAVREVGDEHEAARAGVGPGVAGVRVGVAEGVHILEGAVVGGGGGWFGGGR